MRRLVITLAVVLPIVTAFAGDWSRYRGPNGTGVGDAQDLPVEFGPEKNLAWQAAMPRGTSSPIIVDGAVYLTAFDHDDRLILALDANDGSERWRKTLARRSNETFHPSHGPATPTPASDGERLYVFFPDVGLIALTLEGEEVWRVETGGFNSVQGIAGSPIVAAGLIVLLIDQTVGSYLAAYAAETGRQVWRVDRPSNFMGGYSTPAVYEPAEGPTQLIVAGASELTGYQLATGEKLWWAPGATFAPATVPIVAEGMVYTCEPYTTEAPPFAPMLDGLDKDDDGALSLPELKDAWGLRAFVDRIDGDHGNQDGKLTQDEWAKAFAAFNGQGGLVATRLGGSGNVGESAIAWRYKKSLPYMASALLYDGLLYSVRDGGIFMAIDPATGEVVKEGRVRDAMEPYWASPVAADGKVYVTSREGKVSVLRAGKDWEILATNDLAERAQATPAIASDALYVRTVSKLYCFRKAPG